MSGLTENPWASPCITDLSHHVVKQIFDANSSVHRADSLVKLNVEFQKPATLSSTDSGCVISTI